MARSLQPYYLIRRADRLTGGKPTFYVRFRNPDGSLSASSGMSTGATTKSAATTFAVQRIKDGLVVGRGDITLSGFGKGFWSDSSPYVKGRRARGRRLSPVYLQVMAGYFTNHIEPELGSSRLADLSPQRIDTWLLGLLDKALTPTTANRCRACLSIIMQEATRARLIAGNPCAGVQELAETTEPRGILTLAEIRKLFAERTVNKVWAKDRRMFTLHLFLCASGCRLGEAQGLTVGAVHADYVDLVTTWDRKAGLRKGTKSGAGRPVPIPEKVSKHLQNLVATLPWSEPHDLVFARPDRRGVPVGFTQVDRAFYTALKRIGISDDERRKRSIVVHSWRHALATMLRASKVPDAMTKLVTGHATDSMLELYGSHFRLSDYAPVAKAQERLLG